MGQSYSPSQANKLEAEKRTVICGLHFNKNFLSGPTLLPGATPTIEPVADVVQIGMYKSFAKGVDKILAEGGGTKNFELFPSSQKNTFAPPPPRINFLPPKSFFFPHPP